MEAPELTREQVLKRDIPWETYLTAKLITGSGLQLLRRYDHKPESVQTTLLNEDGGAYIRVFVLILRDITKEETVEYVLALLDELLSIDPKRAQLFHKISMQNEDLYLPFLRLLFKKNWFVQEKACKILTLLISARPRNGEIIGTSNGTLKSEQTSPSTFDDVLQKFVDWLCGQLRQPSHPSREIPIAVSSLATLLGEPKVRTMFVQADGVKLLAPLISPATSQHHIQERLALSLAAAIIPHLESITPYLSLLPRLLGRTKC